MSKTARRFKPYGAVILAAVLCAPSPLNAGEIKKNDSGVYKDVFNHNVLNDNISYLHFDRLGRAITGKKLRAANANIYDEVADSGFFTNRHGRKPLSGADLAEGYKENSGPDLSGALTIVDGKQDGLRPQFVVKDSVGNEYTLYFDTPDSFGLMTGSAVAASRFYHALGYNVPQISLISFSPDKLSPGPDAKIVDTTGFRKKLTKEKLNSMFLLIPWGEDGQFRAAAVKTPEGEDKGAFNYQGRRKADAEDKWPHDRMRELRALRVFSSWLNNFNVRDQNTRDYLVSEDGKTWLKHYITNFEGAFGSDEDGAKRPMIGHEYLYDAGETMKAFALFGFYLKPWQNRWKANGETAQNPAVGYFDNKEFRPARFKTFVPQYVFKDVTRADGFWAAKTLQSFSDEDIRAIVKTAQFTDSADEETVVSTLIERRDLIVKYWFENSTPLDAFEYKDGELVFQDLGAKAGLTGSYEAEAFARKGKKSAKLGAAQVSGASVKVDAGWFQGNDKAEIRIRRAGASVPGVIVRVNADGVAGVIHED